MYTVRDLIKNKAVNLNDKEFDLWFDKCKSVLKATYAGLAPNEVGLELKSAKTYTVITVAKDGKDITAELGL
jgi:hypothetical protein